MGRLTPGFDSFLPGWIARQRWYRAKGREPELELVGLLRYQDPAGEVGIQTWLLRDAVTAAVYQVPLTYRGAPADHLEHALVATAEHSELAPRWIYDGCHDPVGARAIVETILGEQDVSPDDSPHAIRAMGHRARDRHGSPVLPGRLDVVATRVLRGEQSNTSIIVETSGDGPDLIVKVLRVVADGENPDVVLTEALAAGGSTRVPRPAGHLRGWWPGPGAGHESERGGGREGEHGDGRGGDAGCEGHLAVAQEYLPGVEDAWRVAVRAAGEGSGFGERAQELGAATAEVHEVLAAALGTTEAGPGVRASLAAAWRARAADAVETEPTLAARADEIEAVFAAAEAAAWPPVQRIHGDYHLGQVIDSPGRGWVLLDFEGEPLRPLVERNAPDLALRDVAGMLRSLDYVVGAVAPGGAGDTAGAGRSRSWAHEAREAFLTGYGRRAGRDPREDAALLHALELDKALYEVVYESRNRPDWLYLPLAGIARLLRADHGG